MIKYILLILLAIPSSGCGWQLVGSGVSASGGSYTYIGWPNTNGTPSSTPASSHTATATRTFAYCENAPSDGTAVSVNVYIGSAWNPVNASALVYKFNGTNYSIIGNATISNSASTNSWTGDLTLSGADLTFTSGTSICVAASINPNTDSAIGVSTGTGNTRYYNTGYYITPTSWSTLADGTYGVILKYAN